MSVLIGDARQLIKDVPPETFIISDVPYNVGYHYATYKDNMGADDYFNMLFTVFYGRKAVIIHYPEETINLLGGGALGRVEQVVAWCYNSNTAKQSRLITWWNCKPDFKKIPQPYKNPTDKRIAKRIAEGKTCRGYDWWEIDQVKNVSKKENPHPCPIPYELARRIVASTTEPGDLVCDPFAGSGTVLKAAQDLGRKVIGFELDQTYADYANKILKL